MRIFGTHCNPDKALWLSIKSILGINTESALKLCALTGVNPSVKLKNLKQYSLESLTGACRNQLAANLDRKSKKNIQFYIQLKHTRGYRHMFALPSRGQRTRTNASTAKRLAIIKQNKPKTSSSKAQGFRPK